MPSYGVLVGNGSENGCPLQIPPPPDDSNTYVLVPDVNSLYGYSWVNTASENGGIGESLVPICEESADTPNNISRYVNGCLYTPWSHIEEPNANDYQSWNPATGVYNSGYPIHGARSNSGALPTVPADTWIDGPALSPIFDNGIAWPHPGPLATYSMMQGPANGIVNTLPCIMTINMRVIWSDTVPDDTRQGIRIVKNGNTLFQRVDPAVVGGAGVTPQNNMGFNITLFMDTVGDTVTYHLYSEQTQTPLSILFSAYTVNWRVS